MPATPNPSFNPASAGRVNSNVRQGHDIKAAYLTAAVVGVLAIGTMFFQTPILEAVTQFLAPLLFLAVFIVSVVAAVILIVIAVRGAIRKRWRDSGPAALLVGVLAICEFAPLNDWWHTYYFHVHRGAREKAIESLLQLPADQNGRAGIVRLDFPASMSSLGGEVQVVRGESDSAVLFFTFRGILDPFSGFIYTKSGVDPDMAQFGARSVLTMRRLDDHWFYVACGN